MKILHLSKSDLDGGAAKAAYRIHRSLLDRGVDSQFCVGLKLTSDSTVLGPTTTMGKVWGRISRHVDQMPYRIFGPSGGSGLHSPAWVGSCIAQRVKPLRPDLIQLHWICGGFMTPEDLPRLNRPLVWRLADMWAFSGAEHYTDSLIRSSQGYDQTSQHGTSSGFDWDRWVWKRKQKAWHQLEKLTIVAPSRWMARCAEQSILFKNRRIEVIPTGQNTRVFKPIPQSWARELLGIESHKKVVLFSAHGGKEDPRKGFSYLKEALIQYRNSLKIGAQSSEEILCLVLGSYGSPEVWASGLELRFLGKLHDEISLSLVYNAADVFVAPSLQENLANTVIESMACGTPVVAFDVGGMSDLVVSGHSGYLARALDTVDLQKGIAFVLENETRREELSHQCRELIEKNFTVELQAERYQRLYEDILKNQPLGPSS